MEMKRCELTSATPSDFTVEALRQVIPSAFTEVRGEDGQLTHKVDFDRLRELLGDAIADADEERFGFYWVGKQEAKRAAAQPTRQTLRPVEEESVAWESTQNLYIEGDNLEVLKLLQTAYIGKVKMIYIDPPYNTGNDFVYNDDFAMSREEQDEAMGNLDEEGNRLRRNLDSNPRYHSDWCSMIYSRLLVARTLLSNDGVIFISIDDNEVHNLRKICDEVFGASNFVGQWNWFKSATPPNLSKKIKKNIEYILAYQKGNNTDRFRGIKKVSKSDDPTTKPQNAFKTWTFPSKTLNCKSPDGIIPKGIYGTKKFPNELLNDLIIEGGTNLNEVSFNNRFIWLQDTLIEQLNNGTVMNLSKQLVLSFKKEDYNAEVPPNLIDSKVSVGTTEQAGADLETLFNSKVFDYPKPVSLIKYLANFYVDPDSIILDFFSGSATTAHAVMQLNAEDGGKRKYICVQLQEGLIESLKKATGSERKTIENAISFLKSIGKPCLLTEIGKERIRRAGRQIKEGLGMLGDDLDIGFRVLRLDSSNMKEVYFEPGQIIQKNLMGQVDSVKPDRTPLDLLFGCMVDWGVELSLPIRREEVGGKELFIVNNGALVACFEEEIPLETIRYIAGLSPLRLIFRESCFATDADKLNIYEQFKQLCSWSEEEAYRNIRVI